MKPFSLSKRGYLPLLFAMAPMSAAIGQTPWPPVEFYAGAAGPTDIEAEGDLTVVAESNACWISDGDAQVWSPFHLVTVPPGSTSVDGSRHGEGLQLVNGTIHHGLTTSDGATSWFVYRNSKDGGANWSAEQTIVIPDYKEAFRMVVVPGSGFDNVYVALNDGLFYANDPAAPDSFLPGVAADPGRGPVAVSADGDIVDLLTVSSTDVWHGRSLDRGQTWGPFTRIDTTGWNSTSREPEVRTSGQRIVAAWPNNNGGGSNPQLVMVESTDGGLSWGAEIRVDDSTVSNPVVTEIDFELDPNDPDRIVFLYNELNFAGKQTATTADGGASFSHQDHTLWNSHTDLRCSTSGVFAFAHGDVEATYSTDGGSTWTTVFLNPPTTTRWALAAINEATCSLLVSWMNDDFSGSYVSGFDLPTCGPPPPPVNYCTAGTSASGCQALISASGTPSATATSGFDLLVGSVEGQKSGLFFIGTNGRQANPWGNGTSLQCVVPPVIRGGLLTPSGTVGLCDGAFTQDWNALWCPTTCPKPAKNPGAGALVQAQFWYRDPFSSSNQTTSLSDAIEFTVEP